MTKKSMLMIGAASAIILTPSIAFAQEGGNSEIGEILVTARKRQESIMKVPVVVTALPMAQLERLQSMDLKDIATRVPGLKIGTNFGSTGTQVSLRGVGTSTQNAGIDQSVSLNVDGLQMSQALAYASALFDVQLIEVLKGPQSLFYGKNSPGGVIAVKTADPGDRFELKGRYYYEVEAREHRGEVVVSGPVSESLGVRLAGAYGQTDGYFKVRSTVIPGNGSAAAKSRAPTSKNYVLRGTAVFKPSSEFDAKLKVTLVKDKTINGTAPQLASCPDGISAPAGRLFFGVGEDCKLNRTAFYNFVDPAAYRDVRFNGQAVQNIQQRYGTLEMNAHFIPDITLTSVSAYYRVRNDGSLPGGFSGNAGTALISDNVFIRRELTQELRAASDFSGPINFTTGAFFQDGRVFNHGIGRGNTAIGLPVFFNNFEHIMKIQSLSAFGQIRWKIMENLELAGGARWTDEARSDLPRNFITGTPVLVAAPRYRISSSNVSPEFTVTYTPTDDLTLFGSYKRGFKSGSFNLNAFGTPNTDLAFGDEKAQGGEAGIKARLFDRTLAINIAGYHYKYTGLQVGAQSQPNPALPGIPLTLNAGAAKVYGIDFDVTYRPPTIDGLELLFAGEWNHARFTRLSNVPCWGGQMVSEGCTQNRNPVTGLFTAQDLTGFPLLRAPDWQLTFGFDYERPINEKMKIGITSSTQYSSRFLTNLGNRADFYQSSYFKFDLSAALRDRDDRWEIALVGKNIFDRITSGNCGSSNIANGLVLGGTITGGNTRGAAGVDELLCFPDRGRSVLLRLTIKPFG